eukprot:scaffold32061_cov48-Phaeocystis_antarctica.AAC.1
MVLALIWRRRSSSEQTERASMTGESSASQPRGRADERHARRLTERAGCRNSPPPKLLELFDDRQTGEIENR